MGLFGDAKREFIARPDAKKTAIIYKWPDKNIRKFSQLTVAQDETAVFTRDGKVQTTIGAGRTTLDSSEIPLLGDLLDMATGGNMFLTELYFVTSREVTDLPFGGVVDDVVDPQSEIAVGLRVFGDYSLKVSDPVALILNLTGTRNVESNDAITAWTKQLLLKALRTATVTLLSENQWPILGIAAHTEAIEAETLKRANEELHTYGVTIVRMGNFSISISDDDETTLKNFRRDSSYTKLAGGFAQYGTGAALRGIGEGAAKGGNAVGEALLGMGFGVGGLLNGVGASNGGIATQQTSPQTAAGQRFCTACGSAAGANAKFCGNCGTGLG